MARVEFPSNDIAQESIAEKFEPLVAALPRHATVGKRTNQKRGVPEAVAQALLQGLRRHPLRFRRHSIVPLRRKRGRARPGALCIQMATACPMTLASGT